MTSRRTRSHSETQETPVILEPTRDESEIFATPTPRDRNLYLDRGKRVESDSAWTCTNASEDGDE
jgi:hypothetical protein